MCSVHAATEEDRLVILLYHCSTYHVDLSECLYSLLRVTLTSGCCVICIVLLTLCFEFWAEQVQGWHRVYISPFTSASPLVATGKPWRHLDYTPLFETLHFFPDHDRLIRLDRAKCPLPGSLALSSAFNSSSHCCWTFCFFKYWKYRWKLLQSSNRHFQVPTDHFWECVGGFLLIMPTCRQWICNIIRILRYSKSAQNCTLV